MLKEAVTMPRINRVRIHNIHFEAGGQPRIYHDTVFEPYGDNTLLLLGNGGGKTLLLHLIAQVIEPNVPLQGRRIKRLVEKVKFTGHVLVEWLLDGAAPDFLLTGFCFADYTGGGNQGMDYFTYLHRYNAENGHDLLSLALTDAKNRTLNFTQLRESLRESPVKVYASYRRQDYQEQLKSFRIDPREWRYILRINDSEGGIENFFEGCSKTRTLLDKLLIPMIDEVLERREESDPLREAFRGTAREVMDLPQLKVKSEALEALSRRLPALEGDLGRVAEARQQYDRLLQRRGVWLQTVTQGLPRLEGQREELLQQGEQNRRESEYAGMVLEALGVEEKRRVWALLAEKLAAEEKLAAAARQRAEAAWKRDSLYRAFEYWCSILRDEETLAGLAQELQLREQGETAFKEELDRLREATAPLLQRAIAGAARREAELRRRLEEQRRGQEELAGRRGQAESALEGIDRELLRLQTLQERFHGEQREFSKKMAALNIAFDAAEPRPELSRIEQELAGAGEERTQVKKALEQAATSLEELSEDRSKLESAAEHLAGERQQLQERRRQWQEQGLALQGELKVLGCPHHPGEESAAALVWLNLKEEQLAEERSELLQGRRRWQEQEQLWGEGRAPRPHGEIDLVVGELNRQAVTARPVVELLESYSGAERQRMLRERPWLPYALVVEPAQLEGLKQRRLQLSAELSVPVPLIARTDFHEEVAPAELYFLSHRGLERFHSREKAEQYRRKIARELEAAAERLRLLQEQGQGARDLRGRLEGFRREFADRGEAEWAERLRLAGEEHSRRLAELEQLRRRIEGAREKRAAHKRSLERLWELSGVLHRVRDLAQDYCRLHAENEKQSREEARLRLRRLEQEQRLGELQQALAEQEEGIGKSEEELKSVRHEHERYGEARDVYFPGSDRETGADGSHLDGGQRQQLDGLLTELKAKLEALDVRDRGYQDLRERMEGARERIAGWQEDIRRLGLEPDTLRESYRPVEKSEAEQARREAEQERRLAEEAGRQLQEREKETSAASSVYEDRRAQLRERCPHLDPPDLTGADLVLEKERRQSMRRELAAATKRLDEEIALTDDRLNDYRQAAGILGQMEVALSEAVSPLSPEEERAQLLGRACEVVGRSRSEEKEAAARLEEAKQQAVAQLQLCRDELQKLHGEELKQFFKMMEEQTAAPSWEQRVAELQLHLGQVEEAIDQFRVQVEQRLEALETRVAEMVRRTWRHVDGVLEQVRELQRRSQVPLRGERHPLFRITFTRPDETEGANRLRKYLEEIIAEAVRMQKQGCDDAAIDDFLKGAIETARLLDQVVPLDSIEIRLLKPRDNSSYESGQYDRWDDLQEWSQGQRFAGRFALFIVLLSYIRHCRSGGLVTAAVVLADNPFGQASSSHILEIVDAVTRQQNVQLFSCTALRNTEIMREFPVIYSLVPVPTMSGKERMLPEQKRQGERLSYLEQAHARVPRADSDVRGQLGLF